MHDAESMYATKKNDWAVGDLELTQISQRGC
jgi:hypothetical protein